MSMIITFFSGSLWEPRIDVIDLPDDSVLVSFNSTMEATRYYIHVASFQEDGKECKKATQQILEVISCSPFYLLFEIHQKGDNYELCDA